MTNEKWYYNGLKFSCMACGSCCCDHGEYTYVYLEKEDTPAIAQFLQLSQEEFLRRYCVQEDGFTYLKMVPPGCLFLEGKKCRIYSVRPLQCRTWPFWSSNLEKSTWENEVAPYCPGIGQGTLYPEDEIDRISALGEDEEIE